MRTAIALLLVLLLASNVLALTHCSTCYKGVSGESKDVYTIYHTKLGYVFDREDFCSWYCIYTWVLKQGG